MINEVNPERPRSQHIGGCQENQRTLLQLAPLESALLLEPCVPLIVLGRSPVGRLRARPPFLCSKESLSPLALPSTRTVKHRLTARLISSNFFVRAEGIGPSTSVLSGQRSTTELRSLYQTSTPRKRIIHRSYARFIKPPLHANVSSTGATLAICTFRTKNIWLANRRAEVSISHRSYARFLLRNSNRNEAFLNRRAAP